MLDLSRIDEAVRSEGGITRRLLLAYGAALAALPALALRADDQAKKKVKFQHNPFSLGVASGDPSADGFVLWTRLAPRPLQPEGGMPREQVEVHWRLATDEGMKNVVQRGTALAKPKFGHSVHVVVEKLQPNRWYWYRFHCGDAESPVGRTRTMPSAEDNPQRLRFAFASCQNFEDGYYNAYKHMAGDDLDLVIHLGDYIYEFGARKDRVRKHLGDKCKSLDDYRIRYCQYRRDPLLHNMHARCPWLVTWDDHEVEGNYADNISKIKGVPRVDFLKHRAHAYHAYYEMMPLRDRSLPTGPDLMLYRTVSFGSLASFQVLDTRQYRTDQANGDEPSPLNAAALNPKNTLLGAAQKTWLKNALTKSKATWNVLAQQVMMGMINRQGEGKYSMDAWPGYAQERMDLMRFLAEHHISNPVVLTGDVHANWVNELRVDDRRQETSIVATEFVGTSITSSGNGAPLPARRLAALQSVNPFVKFHNDERGYVRCTVTPREWKSDFQVVSDVTKPESRATTAATFVVEAGRPCVFRA